MSPLTTFSFAKPGGSASKAQIESLLSRTPQLPTNGAGKWSSLTAQKGESVPNCAQGSSKRKTRSHAGAQISYLGMSSIDMPNARASFHSVEGCGLVLPFR